MIGALPEYEPAPMLYCNKRGIHCNAYRDDPCDDCPFNASKQEASAVNEKRVKSIFDSFQSLFSIKRDGIDKYPLWRDEESSAYYSYIGQRILNEFIAWRKMAEPYLKSCENKAHQYDLKTEKIEND